MAIDEQQIIANKYAIKQNQMLIVGLTVFTLVIVIGALIVTKHTIHDCETRLYEKLQEQTQQRLPQQ